MSEMRRLTGIWATSLLCVALTGPLASANDNLCEESRRSTDCVRKRQNEAFAAGPVNPISSVPLITTVPELAPPLTDAIGATLQVNTAGAAVTAVVAPIALVLKDYVPVLSDFRLQISTNSGKSQKFSAEGSVGYTSKWSSWDLKDNDVTLANDECTKKLVSTGTDAVWKAADLLRDDLVAAENAYKARNPGAKPLPNPLPPALDPGESTGSELATQVDQYAGKIRAAWKNWLLGPYRKDALPREKRDGNADLEALTKLQSAAHEDFGDCLEKKLTKRRLTNTYHNAWSLRLSGGMSFFPFVSGPSVQDSSGTLQPPAPNLLAGWTAAGNFNFFPNDTVLIYLVGAYASARDKATRANTASRVSAGGGLALNLPTGEYDADGFRKGFALGLDIGYSSCRESAGCSEEVLGYSDSIIFHHLFVFTPFLDVRATSKLTLRISVPVTNYTLAAPPKNSDGGTHVRLLVPTLSATVASWSL
jgi:hypothetical protein